MLNDFGSYADTLDNTKTDLTSYRKNLNLGSERGHCFTGNVTDIGPRTTNLSLPTATWNCNPYLGNFYNYYGGGGNNSYDASDIHHQYDNRKCTVNQFSPRNYTQHSIPSASVLQCCDPRCQLFSDHSKYPFSNTLANKYNNQRIKAPIKNCYDGLEQTTTTASSTSTSSLKPDKNMERGKYSSFAYAPMQPNTNKYNSQQPSNYNTYQSSAKPSKHVLLPSSDTSSFGDYYTDIGKPSYWNKQNSSMWNRGMTNSYYTAPPPPPPPPPQSSFEHDKMQHKIASATGIVHQHEQNNASLAATTAVATNPRGILFNRLLDQRSRMYDTSYLPNYHYGRAPPPTLPSSQNHKVGTASAYYQPYQEREMYADGNNTTAGLARIPPMPLQNSNSYQTLPFYNVHYIDPCSNIPTTVAAAAVTDKETKEAAAVKAAEETKNRLLDKNPNLDVREFLSTWDDVEDDKAPEPETPVIVLDCTSLEAEALAKVKEKLAENITDCRPIVNTPAAIEFNSHASNATVLKVVDDQIVSPHTSVIQESVSDNSFEMSTVSKKDEVDHHHTLDGAPTESSHSGGYNMWYGSTPPLHKKKDDLSYDLVEMTERLVNTVDKLFGDEKSTCSEKESPFHDLHHHPHYKEPTRKNSTTEDEWNINLNYKRNKPQAAHGIAVPESRYNRPTKEDLTQSCKTFTEEPEKNVSCSFNLQKTSNDLKFSVNYSKQTECYATRVQDYSVKCKSASSSSSSSSEKSEKYRSTTQHQQLPQQHQQHQQHQRMEDYTYKNYYNSYYYNNPNYEYMQLHNVKECTYDMENIDRDISNDNASDITLVKADLEKSLKEITHQFSYQKKLENCEKELPIRERPPPPSYDYQDSQNCPNNTNKELPDLPKLDITQATDIKCNESVEGTILATSVIHKTGSCNEKLIYDENSMLSMPSLSPPLTSQENRSIGAVGLTLNDVYEDEVIFDTLNKPAHAEDEQSITEENGLNFLNVKNDNKRESVVYPLNLALAKDKDYTLSVVKCNGEKHEDINIKAKEPDTISKVDDGYYSVENHFDKENKTDFDNQDAETEYQNHQQLNDETKKTVYKTCIVSREQYKQHTYKQTYNTSPTDKDHPVKLASDENSIQIIAESHDSASTPAPPELNQIAANDIKSPEQDVGVLLDTKYRDKLLDDSNKFQNSSTDEEKLLKSSKFKKYKKHKKMKIKESLENQVETGSVIKENGNVIIFPTLFPSIQTSPVNDGHTKNIGNEGIAMMKPSLTSPNPIPFKCQTWTTANNSIKNEMNDSLSVLLSGNYDDHKHNLDSKKHKFTSSVKDADLPVKKRRKQGMTGTEQSSVDNITKNCEGALEEIENVPMQDSSVELSVITDFVIRTEKEISEESDDKYLFNGKYKVETKNIVELTEHKIEDEPTPLNITPLESTNDSNQSCFLRKQKKKHKKDKGKVKNKSSKKQKNKDKLLYQSRKSLSCDDKWKKSPNQTLLDDECNDLNKFYSADSQRGQQVVKKNGENNGKKFYPHKINLLNDKCSKSPVESVDKHHICYDECIARNKVDDPTQGKNSEFKLSNDKNIPFCANFTSQSMPIMDKINVLDGHQLHRRYDWSNEKHALSDGENYTSCRQKKTKLYHKHAFSDDEHREPYFFKQKFVGTRINSVISFPSIQPLLPKCEANLSEKSITYNNTDMNVDLPKSESSKIEKMEIGKCSSPFNPSLSHNAILSPRSTNDLTALYEEPISSIQSNLSEPTICTNPELIQDLNKAELFAEVVLPKSPHTSPHSSLFPTEFEERSNELEVQHKTEPDHVQDKALVNLEVDHEISSNKTDSPSWSKEPIPHYNSPTNKDSQEPAKKPTWSNENSPSVNLVEEYVPQYVSWSPGQVVGECIVETSHEDEEEEEEKEEKNIWVEDLPYHLNENIDHEEAVCDISNTSKSSWSIDNTPVISDNEAETNIQSQSPSPYYEYDGSTNIFLNSPNSSNVKSPNQSVSSSNSSDSDQSDNEERSKESSTKSLSSKASLIDSSDDETFDKPSDNIKYNFVEESLPNIKSLYSKEDSENECSFCEDEDDTVNKLNDDLFNIPSVAPTPHCDLNKEEEDMDELTNMLDGCNKLPEVNSKAPSPNCVLHEEAPSPFCILNEVDHLPPNEPYYEPNHNNVSSVAPSPKCDIIDGVLLNDTSNTSDGFGFEKTFAPVSPVPQQTSSPMVITTTSTPKFEEVPPLRELAANVLAKLSFGSVPSLNRNSLLEVWVTPEQTEIIIHSEDNEPCSQTDLVINDNQVMITDAYGEDEDVNIVTNFDQIKEIAFDYATMGIDSSVTAINDKSDEELQCQCLIISSEESVVCLRCSLNSSIIVNQDVDVESHFNIIDKPGQVVIHKIVDNENPEMNPMLLNETKAICNSDTFIPVDCIEESFIDQKIFITPEHISEEIDSDFVPIINVGTQTKDDEADVEVKNIIDSSITPEITRNSRHVQLKVQLPWHKIFNLSQTNNKCQEQKVLELGPAKIQVRLSPDDPNLLKLMDMEQERVSPVVKVKRLVLQRATNVDKHSSDSNDNNDAGTTQNFNLDTSKKNNISRLPKMVIKKTNYKEYKSFLQLNTFQPVVKLYKNKCLDELARKMCKLKNYSINLQKFKSFSFHKDINYDEIFDADPSCSDKDEEEVTPVIRKANKKCGQEKAVNPVSSDMVPSLKRDLASIPESHHCLLCHRSFPSEDSYRIHVKGRFHRHLELTQRKTIHAMYRHFTGHVCPRLRPLSAKERKKMKWKPRSTNVNHFYHEKTPLQIALHKSVFEKEPDA